MMNQNVHGIIILVFLFFAAAAVPFVAGQAAAPSPRPWNQDFNPLMAILMVALISAFFFLGFFFIYVHQCFNDGRNRGSVRPMNGAAGRGKRGLDQEVIETFPMVNYSDVKVLKIGKGELECAVCLNEFEDDETLRLLPKCDHVFHPECIDAWLFAHVTCPVCRTDLKPESIDVVVTDDIAAAAVIEEVSDSDERNNEVAISFTDDQDPQSEVIKPNQTPIQNRQPSLESTRIDGKFPRCHSTGHSLLIQPGENCERFTLRLPDDVRKQIVNGRLNRTTSSYAFPTGDGNVKSDRWIFSMAPPFFTRTSSVKSQKVTDGDGSFGGNNS